MSTDSTVGGLARGARGSDTPDRPLASARARLAAPVLVGAGAASPARSADGLFEERSGSVLRDLRPETRGLGFYLHVPFCVRRCHYCSFTTAPLETGALAPYLAALRGELDLLAALDWAPAARVTTVFLGGGTPSLLDPAELAGVLDRLRAGFALAPDAEVTVECNPESVTRPKLEAYRRAGVTRVSLGVQSLDDALLARLGRLHDARGARAAFAAGREAGFADVSVDLMYGLPGLDAERWARTVTGVLDWAPDHLSAYGLTLDGGSRWGTPGVADLPPEDDVVAQYWTLAHAAAARGLEHYEVSNWARPGHRARHNENYWRAGEYLAAGPGACGHVGGVRWSNAKTLARYRAAVAAGALPVETHEVLAPRQRRAERLILGLRTTDGVPASWLAERAADDPALGRRLAAWRERALLQEAGGRARLSEAGFLVSDALFVELL